MAANWPTAASGVFTDWSFAATESNHSPSGALFDQKGTSMAWRLHSQVDGRNVGRLPGLIVVCFGGFWVRGLPFPNARHLGHPFHWKNTLPWHLGPTAKVRILPFKNLPPFRHYRGLQNHL